MKDFILLKEELEKWNINITDNQLFQFSRYYELLVSWNEKINLTSITDYEGVIYKHFLDSISLMKTIDLSNKKVLDIGTGAGFPGIPLAIMNPNCNFYLLDSLNKRIIFLNEVISELNINNVKTYHGRAEDFGFDKKFRENFDVVVSRAVANLSSLSEYCLPFVKIDGSFVSYKGEQSDEEINSSLNALKILGGNINRIDTYSLESEELIERRLVVINKVKHTPKSYPRKAGTPTKMPL